MASAISDQIADIKLQVLQSQRAYLCANLGDPSCYYPSLKAKGVLDANSVAVIKSKVTDSDKVDTLIDQLDLHKQGSHLESPLDVLVDAIYSRGMQNHIARVLLKAFLRECAKKNIYIQYGDAGVEEGPLPQTDPESMNERRMSNTGHLAVPLQAQSN